MQNSHFIGNWLGLITNHIMAKTKCVFGITFSSLSKTCSVLRFNQISNYMYTANVVEWLVSTPNIVLIVFVGYTLRFHSLCLSFARSLTVCSSDVCVCICVCVSTTKYEILNFTLYSNQLSPKLIFHLRLSYNVWHFYYQIAIFFPRLFMIFVQWSYCFLLNRHKK